MINIKANLIIYYIIMTSIIIFFMNIYKFHPMLLSLFLILYTIIVCLKMNFMKNNYWYSYILFLVMVGGIMILFMYFTSILSNMYMLYLNKFVYLDILLYIMYMLIIFLYNYYYFSFNIMLVEFNNFISNQSMYSMYKNLYMNMYMDMNIFLMLYLLFMMISVMLICVKDLAPLRKMN